jgi:hypothetical protein
MILIKRMFPLTAACFSILLSACNEDITLPMPQGTICSLYPITYTPSKTYGTLTADPAAVKPPFLTWVPNRFALTGTPTGSDFGTYDVAINGAYSAPGWFGYSTWSAKGTMTVPPPSLSFNPVVIHVPSGNLDATVTLVGEPLCAYTVALTINDTTITLNPATVTTSATTGIGTFTLKTDVDMPRTSKVTATITPRAPSTDPAVTTSISVIVP